MYDPPAWVRTNTRRTPVTATVARRTAKLRANLPRVVSADDVARAMNIGFRIDADASPIWRSRARATGQRERCATHPAGSSRKKARSVMTRSCAALVAALGEVLDAIGVEHRQARGELTEMSSWCFGSRESRRVLGSMNDFAWLLAAVPSDETLLAAALCLADATCSPIGRETPKHATLALFRTTEPGRSALSVLQYLGRDEGLLSRS
jgi:hypothetical protein